MDPLLQSVSNKLDEGHRLLIPLSSFKHQHFSEIEVEGEGVELGDLVLTMSFNCTGVLHLKKTEFSATYIGDYYIFADGKLSLMLLKMLKLQVHLFFQALYLSFYSNTHLPLSLSVFTNGREISVNIQ